MQALTFKRYGKSPDIGLADVPRPTPKADELLVQVHADGLNPIDNMIPKGMFKPVLHFQLPATLGSDLAGIVTEVGSNVTRFKPGDAVFASIFDLGTGAIAQFAVVPESAAALKHSCRVGRYRYVRNPVGQTPRCKGGHHHQYRQR